MAESEPKTESAIKSEPSTGNTESGELTTKEAYFASLNSWVKNANTQQNAMALFPWYLLSSYPQIFQNQVTASRNNVPSVPNQVPNVNLNANQPPAPGRGFTSSHRILSDQAQADIIHRIGGYDYKIAAFWKRAVAEVIDVLILLLLKVMITFTIMNIFDLDLGFDLDKEVLRKAFADDDYAGFLIVSMDFLAFSSDLLMLEVLTKVIVCFYEAIWTSMYDGATPGKTIMNLRIKYVEAMLPLQQPLQQPRLRFQPPSAQMRALIFPAEKPCFWRALFRAVAKNMIMTLLFPMCFIMFFFKNNRTVYDIITKTIVVEGNGNRVLWTQQQ